MRNYEKSLLLRPAILAETTLLIQKKQFLLLVSVTFAANFSQFSH